MTEVEIYRGDTPKFSFAVKKRDGSVFDLTNSEVYFAARDLYDPSATLVFDVTCTITDAGSGLCEAQLDGDDTTPAGSYLAEVEVRDTPVATTYIYTAIQFELTIKDDVRKGT